jgi:hypothetical protein
MTETAALDRDEAELVFFLPELEPPQPTIITLSTIVDRIDIFIVDS